jgi:hypothetical protein
MRWRAWREHFEANAHRAMPCVRAPIDVPDAWRAPLVRSLARFQLGETGEGRVAREVWSARIEGIDDDYRVALGLFVREEGRHAKMLADVVHAMGGRLLAKSWTERAFRRIRRAAGLREKMFVLLVAEVVGVAFYGAIAARLPRGPLRDVITSICDDEAAHLAFHGDFFRTQTRDARARAAFRVAFAAGAAVAGAIVLVDHAPALRALGIASRDVASSMRALVALAIETRGAPRALATDAFGAATRLGADAVGATYSASLASR